MTRETLRTWRSAWLRRPARACATISRRRAPSSIRGRRDESACPYARADEVAAFEAVVGERS
jgi:hypothetical protein